MSAPVVTVRGEAHLEGPPDLATLGFTAHRSGPGAEKVGTELAEASRLLREVVTTHGPAIEKQSTAGTHVGPVFRPGSARVHGFRGSFSAELVVSDLAALSQLVFALAAIPSSQVDGPYWSLRSGNPMYRQVRLAAIEDARVRAVDYASAFGGSLDQLVEVSDLDSGFSGSEGIRSSTMAFTRESQEQPEFDFEPALQTVTGQVTVRFTLTVPDLAGGWPGKPDAPRDPGPPVAGQ
jgi:uncharacterized protein YggE